MSTSTSSSSSSNGTTSVGEESTTIRIPETMWTNITPPVEDDQNIAQSTNAENDGEQQVFVKQTDGQGELQVQTEEGPSLGLSSDEESETGSETSGEEFTNDSVVDWLATESFECMNSDEMRQSFEQHSVDYDAIVQDPHACRKFLQSVRRDLERRGKSVLSAELVDRLDDVLSTQSRAKDETRTSNEETNVDPPTDSTENEKQDDEDQEQDQEQESTNVFEVSEECPVEDQDAQVVDLPEIPNVVEIVEDVDGETPEQNVVGNNNALEKQSVEVAESEQPRNNLESNVLVGDDAEQTTEDDVEEVGEDSGVVDKANLFCSVAVTQENKTLDLNETEDQEEDGAKEANIDEEVVDVDQFVVKNVLSVAQPKEESTEPISESESSELETEKGEEQKEEQEEFAEQKEDNADEAQKEEEEHEEIVPPNEDDEDEELEEKQSDGEASEVAEEPEEMEEEEEEVPTSVLFDNGPYQYVVVGFPGYRPDIFSIENPSVTSVPARFADMVTEGYVVRKMRIAAFEEEKIRYSRNKPVARQLVNMTIESTDRKDPFLLVRLCGEDKFRIMTTRYAEQIGKEENTEKPVTLKGFPVSTLHFAFDVEDLEEHWLYKPSARKGENGEPIVVWQQFWLSDSRELCVRQPEP